MKVRAPFTIDHPPTLFMLAALSHPSRPHDVERWELKRPDDYLKFLTYQWDEGESFVNVEHDVEFEPSVVNDLWECDAEWCWAPYRDVTPPQLPHLGMTKISRSLIEKTHDIWKDFNDDSTVIRMRWQRQPTWSMLDGYLWRYAQRAGIRDHRHRQFVTNRRPDNVERMADDSMAGFLHG